MSYLPVQVTAWNWHLQGHKENHTVNSSSFWMLKGPNWSWHVGARKGLYKSSRSRVTYPNTQRTSQVTNHKGTGASWGQCVLYEGRAATQLQPLLSRAWDCQRLWVFKRSWKVRFWGGGEVQAKHTCKTDMVQVLPGFTPWTRQGRASLRPLEITQLPR